MRPQASLDYALANSTTSSSAAALAAAVLPIRTPAHLYESASLQLRSPSVAARPALSSAAVVSCWGITGVGSDDKFAQQLLQVWFTFCRTAIMSLASDDTYLQRAMLNSQVSQRGKSIQQWWAWYALRDARFVARLSIFMFEAGGILSTRRRKDSLAEPLLPALSMSVGVSFFSFDNFVD